MGALSLCVKACMLGVAREVVRGDIQGVSRWLGLGMAGAAQLLG